MASSGNRHCANCIGAISFPTGNHSIIFTLLEICTPYSVSLNQIRHG